jgi:hypothetical protein
MNPPLALRRTSVRANQFCFCKKKECEAYALAAKSETRCPSGLYRKPKRARLSQQPCTPTRITARERFAKARKAANR